jgi:hypothetical protein
MAEDIWPPKPEWRPEITLDLARIEKTCAYYLDHGADFAVFENGTCVFIDTETDNVLENTSAKLTKIISAHPDFKSEKMDDGNWMVTYNQPVMNVIFFDEYERHRKYIEHHFKQGVLKHEVFRAPSGETVEMGSVSDQIGLLGRARMFMDALNPVIIRIWRKQ